MSLSRHGRRLLVEAFDGLKASYQEISRFFQQVKRPEDGTRRDVVKVLTRPTHADFADSARAMAKLVDFVNRYSTSDNDAVVRDAMSKMTALSIHIQSHFSTIVIRLEQKRIDDAVAAALDKADSAITQCRELIDYAKIIIAAFVGADNVGSDAPDEDETDNDDDDDDSYDSDDATEDDEETRELCKDLIVDDDDDGGSEAPTEDGNLE